MGLFAGFDFLSYGKADLTSPPIGVHKESSGCLSRCSSYTYRLLEEEVSVYDDDMDRTAADLYLHFASSTVETWTEYRLEGPLGFATEIGGALGLVLGASLLSLSLALVDGAGAAARMIAAGGGGKGKRRW